MRKIKWGVLGTAYIFERDTAEGMRQAENCQLYAIAGRSMEKAKAFQEKYGFQKAYGSYDELLADESVEAIYNPLPNTMHHEWTIKALKAKKHVLCEKPLAATEQEAREMFEAAKENGVCLMEAFAYLHSPYIRALKEELPTIGDIRYIEVAHVTSDYDKSNIRMRRETLGGCTYDLGVYCSSLILQMMGEEPEKVQAIAALSPEGIDLCTTTLLKYANGASINFVSGMKLATEKNSFLSRFQIHGTLGSISSEKFGFNMQGEMSYRVKTFDGRDEMKTVFAPQNYRLEVEQMGRCIVGEEMPAVSEEFSIANARLIDKILSDIHYGRID